MLGKLTTSSYKREASLTSSIAFLPTVISTAFLILGVGLLYFEASPISSAMEERLPSMLVPGKENARSILNIIANGIISLTVFSFSMVMVVLSQASSTQSPRIIPGLTTARSNQVVLGFYIGTIIYTLLLLLNFEKGQSGVKETPAIAILMSIVFAITCLVLFVYFIHSISKAVQVDNIMNSVFLNAKKALQYENEIANKTKRAKVDRVRELNYALKNLGNGYLRRVDLTELKQIAREHDLQLEIAVEVGAFIVEGTPCCAFLPTQKSLRSLGSCCRTASTLARKR